MILVECFDPRSPIANIAACLQLRPERVIYLGEKAHMEDALPRYQNFFRSFGMHLQVEDREVCLTDVAGTVDTLLDIFRCEQVCTVDITGGDERMMVAMGAALAAVPQQQRSKIRLQRFNLNDNTVHLLDQPGSSVAVDFPRLSVDALIRLHGGLVYPAADQPSTLYGPRHLQELWDIMRDDPKEWNRRLSLLNEFESKGGAKIHVRLSRSVLQERIKKFEEKEPLFLALLEVFSSHGVIRDHSWGDQLDYTYASPLLRYCTFRAGNILEIRSLLEARDLRDGNQAYFDDCQMGVHIDWDGQVPNQQNEDSGTHNEIDLILTRGITPLFVSCKNGDIGDDELYKLHTVAHRFGGPYARKMLICSDLDRKNEKADLAYSQRARDMGIYLVTDAATHSTQQWQEDFRRAMEGAL
jgi:hypothetical protein